MKQKLLGLGKWSNGAVEITKNEALKGEALFGAVEEKFKAAGAKTPAEAPNYKQLPQDHGDRKVLPEIKAYKTLIIAGVVFSYPIYYTDEEKQELLKTGKYIPQNKSDTPLYLSNFDAAETSKETKAKEAAKKTEAKKLNINQIIQHQQTSNEKKNRSNY